MPQLEQTLDRARRTLRRSARRVARAPGATLIRGREDFEPEPARRTRNSAFEQSVAALQAVVWITSFVQGVFNEIRGRSDEL